MQVSIEILLGYRDCVGYIAAIFVLFGSRKIFSINLYGYDDLILVLP